MESPIKLLAFVSIGLFSYGVAEASLQKDANNQKIAWLNAAFQNDALYKHVASNSAGSGALVLISQLSNSEQPTWPNKMLTDQNGTNNPDNSANFDSKNQSENNWTTNVPVVAFESSMGWGFNASNEMIKKIPLPTATWLFLGVLIGFLRIQRKKPD
jgi:hypothetical protein